MPATAAPDRFPFSTRSALTTLQRLQAILQKVLDVAPEALQPDARLDSIGIDSLAMIDILFSIEDEFKITISAEQAKSNANLRTLGDLVEFVDSLIA